MLEKFGLDKALEVAIDFGADLLLGGKSKLKSDSDIEESGTYFSGDRDTSSGFLGRVAKAAYNTFGAGATAEQQAQQRGMSIEEIQRAAAANSRFRPGAVGRPQGTRFTPTNVMYLEALKRRMQMANYDADLEKLTSRYTIPVRPTLAGTKIPSPGSTTIKRTTAAPRLKLDKSTTATV